MFLLNFLMFDVLSLLSLFTMLFIMAKNWNMSSHFNSYMWRRWNWYSVPCRRMRSHWRPWNSIMTSSKSFSICRKFPLSGCIHLLCMIWSPETLRSTMTRWNWAGPWECWSVIGRSHIICICTTVAKWASPLASWLVLNFIESSSIFLKVGNNCWILGSFCLLPLLNPSMASHKLLIFLLLHPSLNSFPGFFIVWNPAFNQFLDWAIWRINELKFRSLLWFFTITSFKLITTAVLQRHRFILLNLIHIHVHQVNLVCFLNSLYKTKIQTVIEVAKQ